MRAVALDEPYASAVPALRVDRDTGFRELLDVAIDRPDRYPEVGGERGRRGASARLEVEQERDLPAGTTVYTRERTTSRRSNVVLRRMLGV